MAEFFGAQEVYQQREEHKRQLLIKVLVASLLIFTLGVIAITSSTTSGSAMQDTSSPSAGVVLMPKVTIERGEELQPEMFQVVQRELEHIPDNAVRSLEEIEKHFSGQTIRPGEPLKREYVMKVRPAKSITTQIPEGYRAVTILVDSTSSVEGWVHPGAHVDVLWVYNVNNEPSVSAIVENTMVLSAGRIMKGNEALQEGGLPLPGTVTLLVSKDDAKKIQLASGNGLMSLTLRGDYGSGKISGVSGIRLRDLFDSDDDDILPYEGELRIRGRNGDYEEWIVEKGQLVRKKEKTGEKA